ncbi:MAG: AlbA family DNA-binding domain-containing protein [Nocardioides sp.]
MPYLSPQTPRWQPADEAALEVAAREGLLEETHYLELKERVDLGKAANRELARDLAAFAVDGGTLVIGVREHDDRAPELVPVKIAGLAERIEQIAHTAADPPLPITCTSLPAHDRPGMGYLIVQVPATGTAPHMVDGVYMGRGDKTKIRLSDADVSRLHDQRLRAGRAVADLVSEYVARDPVPREVSRQAHLFVVAAPVSPRPEMLLTALPQNGWRPFLAKLLDDGAYPTTSSLPHESPVRPSLRSVSEFARRSDGVALTYNLTPDRGWNLGATNPEDIVEVEVTEDGAIRVLNTRASDTAGGAKSAVLFEEALPDSVRRTVGMAEHIANQTGYLGPWMIGAAMTGIAGLSAYGEGRLLRSPLASVGIDTDEYRQQTTASYVELQQTPGAVTARIVGRFLRSIGFADSPAIAPLLTD